MIRKVIDNAWYGEGVLDFSYAVLLLDKSLIQTNFANIPIDPLDRNVLFLRCWSGIVKGVAVFKMAGQSHLNTVSRGNVEWTSLTKKWNKVGDGYGVNTVLYDNLGNLIQGSLGFGSQGLRYFDGKVFTGDDTYYDQKNQLSQWSECEGIRVGQDQSTDNCVVVIADKDGNQKKRLLEFGSCRNIHFTGKNNQYAITVGKPFELKTIFYWISRDELLKLPVLVVVPVPIPIPPIENKPPMIVPNRSQDLNTFKSSYGNVANDDDSKRRFIFAFAAFLNTKEDFPRWGGKARSGVSEASKATLSYWIGIPVPHNPTDGKVHAFQLVSSSGNVSWDTRAEKGDAEYNNIDARFFPSSQVVLPPNPLPPPISDLEMRVQNLESKLNQLLSMQTGPIKYGDKIALQADAGYYLCAISGGAPEGSVEEKSGSVNATRTGIGGWETFTIKKP